MSKLTKRSNCYGKTDGRTDPNYRNAEVFLDVDVRENQISYTHGKKRADRHDYL